MATIARRLGVVAVCLAVAGSVAAVPPAQAADEGASGIPTRTVVTSTNFHPVYGQSFTIRGQVQLVSAGTAGAAPTYTPFPKQPVALQLCTSACYSRTPTWKHVASTTTSDDAKAIFAFPLVARATRVYRVVFDASKYLGIIQSSAGAIRIDTHRRLSMTLRQPRPRRFVMAGRVTPMYGRQTAYLMRKSCNSCAFKTVQRVRTTRTGAYRFAFSAPGRTSTYVVRARAYKGLSVSYSKMARVLVR
jgi:hypothetical protein